jgi:hypothetical protein
MFPQCSPSQEREYAIGDLPIEVTDPVAGTTKSFELQETQPDMVVLTN